VAQRVRHAAHARGTDISAVAGTEQSLPIDLDAADVVLVGPHLEHSLEGIRRDAAVRGVVTVLLPPDIFGDRDGTRTLALIDAALATDPSDGKDTPMPEVSRTIRIGSSNGLHARPAKLFAQAVKDAGIPITISKGASAPVNAASILGVISLGAEKGDYVTLTADGDAADSVLDTLAELLTTDHDE